MHDDKAAIKKPGARNGHLPSRVHAIPVTPEDSLLPEESLAEIESEIGQNAWIDPETGEPAEGESPPHLDD